MTELKDFYIESPTFLARREIRTGTSEHQIRRDVEQHEPWRLPVTIVEVPVVDGKNCPTILQE